MIDSHCHLDHAPLFDDIDNIIKRSKEIGIEKLLTICTTLEIVRKISFMLYPIIPQSSLNALKIFSINENQIDFSTIENHNYLSNLDTINKIDILFKKIEKNND